ncbi:class Ib ribonucleoside-diphosphate reductase assembly flavoprotein NrdI [Loigolactobacillus iwatensis]|uniref:class Ib ribonucleoside-diphosphate reductase assembly flavoprotein NrdI n=1 Tax=Loigolactobacillus iwatensis TaxID=1267156 RepID=UPI000F7ED21D|nr:class Ib ribonucleoside-diphosphate reductase assembly flavoprotein NrdI [Loigolactobacillus iwatensis]
MLNILYISISGNTRSFVEDLQTYAAKKHQEDANEPLISLKEISEATPYADETQAYFAFVPTYLDGGNGIDNGVDELMTNAMGEYIAYHKNRDYCLGVIGSGNRNFNEQYCLTAKMYARDYNMPFIGDYELRGTSADVKRIYAILKDRQTKLV